MRSLIDTGLMVGGRRVLAAASLGGPRYVYGRTQILVEDTGTDEGNLAAAEEAAKTAAALLCECDAWVTFRLTV